MRVDLQHLVEAGQIDLPELPPRKKLFEDPLDKDFLKARQMVRDDERAKNIFQDEIIY